MPSTTATTATVPDGSGPTSGAGSEIAWAPIMGVGYTRNLTTWYNGTSTIGCTSYHNDISIIAGSTNNFGLRADDYGDTHITATPITLSITDFSATGLINSATDKDVFKFTLAIPTNLRMSVIPQNVGSGNSGANVDIRVSLLNYKADTIGTYNPSDLLNAGVDSNLNSGNYYLVVEGVGNTYLNDYGSERRGLRWGRLVHSALKLIMDLVGRLADQEQPSNK